MANYGSPDAVRALDQETESNTQQQRENGKEQGSERAGERFEGMQHSEDYCCQPERPSRSKLPFKTGEKESSKPQFFHDTVKYREDRDPSNRRHQFDKIATLIYLPSALCEKICEEDDTNTKSAKDG